MATQHSQLALGAPLWRLFVHTHFSESIPAPRFVVGRSCVDIIMGKFFFSPLGSLPAVKLFRKL